jgi:hypothetical protein
LVLHEAEDLNVYSHPERINFDEAQEEILSKELFEEESIKNK